MKEFKEFRFAVGTPNGLRSSVWKLWTSKREFYVKSRMMGSTVKVSVHSEGVAQYSMESPWYGKHRPNQPNRDRHIERWEWNEPTDNAASMVFRVFIPQSELREVKASEHLSGVIWLEAPGEGKQAHIICYASPAPLSEAPVDAPGFLCALERGNGSIVVFAQAINVTPEDLHQTREVKKQASDWAMESEHEILPSYRMAALAKDAEGRRALIEFVPV